MSALVCFRLKPWQPPTIGKPIGPAYRFKRGPKGIRLETSLNGLGPQSFRVEWLRPNDRIHPVTIYLFRKGETEAVAKYTWYPHRALSEEIQINDPSLRGTGLGCVLTNIGLKDIFSHTNSLQNLRTTRTLAHADSTLAIVGLRGKFGIDCYQLKDREAILTTFWDLQNPIIPESVQGNPDQYYLLYTISSWRVVSSTYSHKISLLSREDQSDLGLHIDLARNRPKLQELVRSHQAYLSSSLCIDPEKVGIMEEYVAQLPENENT